MKLKVGWATVDVSPLDEDASNASGANGLYHHDHHKRIQVRASKSPEDQARILLHECLHAVYDVYRLEGTKREEEVCKALDGPLATLFRDNPELLGVLHQALSNGKPIFPQGGAA